MGANYSATLDSEKNLASHHVLSSPTNSRDFIFSMLCPYVRLLILSFLHQDELLLSEYHTRHCTSNDHPDKVHAVPRKKNTTEKQPNKYPSNPNDPKQGRASSTTIWRYFAYFRDDRSMLFLLPGGVSSYKSHALSTRLDPKYYAFSANLQGSIKATMLMKLWCHMHDCMDENLRQSNTLLSTFYKHLNTERRMRLYVEQEEYFIKQLFPISYYSSLLESDVNPMWMIPVPQFYQWHLKLDIGILEHPVHRKRVIEHLLDAPNVRLSCTIYEYHYTRILGFISQMDSRAIAKIKWHLSFRAFGSEAWYVNADHEYQQFVQLFHLLRPSKVSVGTRFHLLVRNTYGGSNGGVMSDDDVVSDAEAISEYLPWECVRKLVIRRRHDPMSDHVKKNVHDILLCSSGCDHVAVFLGRLDSAIMSRHSAMKKSTWIQQDVRLTKTTASNQLVFPNHCCSKNVQVCNTITTGTFTTTATAAHAMPSCNVQFAKGDDGHSVSQYHLPMSKKIGRGIKIILHEDYPTTSDPIDCTLATLSHLKHINSVNVNLNGYRLTLFQESKTRLYRFFQLLAMGPPKVRMEIYYSPHGPYSCWNDVWFETRCRGLGYVARVEFRLRGDFNNWHVRYCLYKI